MTNKKPKISVVIATKNRFDDIIKCIESILIQTLLPDETVIVDASDTEKLKLKIKEFKSVKTKFVYIHTKAGMTYQWNVGVKNSCGDIVFILDDDTILEKDFIKEIVKIFKEDKERKIGGVCGDIINIKNRNYSIMQSILIAIYRTMSRTWANIFFLSKLGNGKFRLSGFSTYRYGSTKISIVECLPGGLTAYRREVLNEFKFNENMRYMADDDFSYKVSRKYQNVYTPYAKLVHNVSPTAREKAYMRNKLFIESYHHHVKKNIPQIFKHKFAFYMAICGLFIGAIIYTIIKGNIDGLRGFIDGLLDIKGKRGD